LSDLAIEVRNVNKVFRIYPDLVRSRIKQHILVWKKYYQEKTALRNINLKVNKGEVVGVIGPNAAGKTTLLKIIARISFPTSGEIVCPGRVVAVLALGLGFHPRLTGSENIELAGMMLGMSKAEVRARKEWIVDFSELDEYIDRPLTSYSMGMRARLSFAVAACQNPEILIIDEALATGDIRFVQKCIHRIHEIVDGGATALFVSHNIWSIKKLTHRCILLNEGEVIDDGDTGEVTDRYYEVMLRNDVLKKSQTTYDLSDFVGTGEVQLKKIQMVGQKGDPCELVHSGDPVKFVLDIAAERDHTNVGFSLQCWRTDGVSAFSTSMAGGVLDNNSNFCENTFDLPQGLSTLVVEFLPLLLAPGDFYLNLHIFDMSEHGGYTTDQQFYFKTRIMAFRVRRAKNPNIAMVYYQPARIYLA